MSMTRPQKHNEMVSRLWADYAKGANERVPITFATDEYVWLGLTGNTFREFYTDPRVQLQTCLRGDEWFRENVVHDRPIGLPDQWGVAARFWMDEPECFGCEVDIQEDDYAWSRPVDLPKADLLRTIADLDPREMVLNSRLWRLHMDIKDLAQDMSYRDRPVQVVFPGGGTHGVFTVASRVRGPDRLCVDMLDDPQFADEFIGLIADKTVERIKAWHELAETGRQFPLEGGWGMADDALEFLSGDMFRSMVLPHHRRMYDQMTTGGRHAHLCGKAQQHYDILYDELGVRTLDGPGPFVDHAAVLAQLPELRINAQTDDVLVMRGPVGDIDEMLRRLLTVGAKQPGRLNVTGFLFRDTPLSHVQAMYEAGKRYGGIA